MFKCTFIFFVIVLLSLDYSSGVPTKMVRGSITKGGRTPEITSKAEKHRENGKSQHNSEQHMLLVHTGSNHPRTDRDFEFGTPEMSSSQIVESVQEINDILLHNWASSSGNDKQINQSPHSLSRPSNQLMTELLKPQTSSVNQEKTDAVESISHRDNTEVAMKDSIKEVTLSPLDLERLEEVNKIIGYGHDLEWFANNQIPSSNIHDQKPSMSYNVRDESNIIKDVKNNAPPSISPVHTQPIPSGSHSGDKSASYSELRAKFLEENSKVLPDRILKYTRNSIDNEKMDIITKMIGRDQVSSSSAVSKRTYDSFRRNEGSLKRFKAFSETLRASSPKSDRPYYRDDHRVNEKKGEVQNSNKKLVEDHKKMPTSSVPNSQNSDMVEFRAGSGIWMKRSRLTYLCRRWQKDPGSLAREIFNDALQPNSGIDIPLNSDRWKFIEKTITDAVFNYISKALGINKRQ